VADELLPATTPEAPAQPAQETPQFDGSSIAAAAESAPVAPAVDAAPAASTATAPPAPQSTPSWLEKFRSQGIDLPQDENAALQHLQSIYQSHRQMQPTLPYYNSFLQHWGEFSQYLANKNKPATEESKPRPWYGDWNAPEYKPEWEALITRDAQGNLVPAPGAPPDVVPKYLAARQHTTEFLSNFARNPWQTLEQPISNLIEEKANALIEQRLAKMQETQQAQSFVQQNSPWIYATDQNGQPLTQPVLDPLTGRTIQQPVLTPFGQQLQTYAAQEHEWQQKQRINDPFRMQQVAVAFTQRDALANQNAQLQQELAALKAQLGQPQAQAQAQAQPQMTTREQANARALSAPAPGKRPGSNHVQAPTPVTDANFDSFMINLMRTNGAAN